MFFLLLIFYFGTFSLINPPLIILLFYDLSTHSHPRASITDAVRKPDKTSGFDAQGGTKPTR